MGDVANLTITVSGDGIEATTIQLNNLTDASARTGDQADKTRQSETDLNTTFALTYETAQKAIEGISKIFDTMMELVNVAKQENDAQIILLQTLSSTGDACGLTARQLGDLAESYQNTTTYSHLQITAAEGVLASFTNLNGQGFQRALDLSTDIATKFGMDLPSATRLLGRALEEPATGLSALTRYMGQLDPAQKTYIENMARMGDITGAQNALMDILTQKFGGLSQAVGADATSAFQRFQNALEVEEAKIGNFISNAASPLLNVFTALLSGQNIAQAFQTAADAMNNQYVNSVAQFMEEGDAYVQAVNRTAEQLGVSASIVAEHFGPVTVSQVRAYYDNLIRLQTSATDAFDITSQHFHLGVQQMQNDLTLTADIANHAASIASGNTTNGNGSGAGGTTATGTAVGVAAQQSAFDQLVRTNEQLNSLNANREATMATINQLLQQQTDMDTKLAMEDQEYAQNKLALLQQQAALEAQMAQKQQTDLERELADQNSIKRAIDEQRQAEQAVNAEMDKLGKSLLDLGANAGLSALMALGKSMTDAASGGKTLAQTIGDIGLKILEALPQMLLMAGLQVIGMPGGMAIGIGLIVASGLVAIGAGIAEGVAANPTGSASGNVFDANGITGFASGGVVSRPTIFPFAGGTGLMGEAGPEAIMPLTRTASGALGVTATPSAVNIVINNNTGAQVTQSESTGPGGQRQIEITIGSIVKNMIANGGADGVMRARYGVQNQGVKN
jgi:hypothetical protein